MRTATLFWLCALWRHSRAFTRLPERKCAPILAWVKCSMQSSPSLSHPNRGARCTFATTGALAGVHVRHSQRLFRRSTPILPRAP
ncbi:hypothetical protein BV20DRAFT_962461 [Pilatotrama ljubarskyi]|nr:hypothetical protein BV20DRAFT_962461 [Pilatotrama ljubarskyi]